MGFFSKLWKGIKKVIKPIAAVASFIPGPWQPFAAAATGILGAVGSYKSGERAIDLADAQRQLGERAIEANPWYAGEGAAGAGEALTSAIGESFAPFDENLENDPQYLLAQKAAAATSSTQPGGYSAMAAANAAMQTYGQRRGQYQNRLALQNDRIRALSQPAGAGFNPVGNYQVAGNLQQSAAQLESQAFGDRRFGEQQALRAGTQVAGAVLPWLQDWLTNRGLSKSAGEDGTYGTANTDWNSWEEYV